MTLLLSYKKPDSGPLLRYRNVHFVKPGPETWGGLNDRHESLFVYTELLRTSYLHVFKFILTFIDQPCKYCVLIYGWFGSHHSISRRVNIGCGPAA
jgi:hypothetical protein